MRFMVNGEPWVLHFRHRSQLDFRHRSQLVTRYTQARLHRGWCVTSPCSSIQGEDAALFIFPTNVLRRRAAFAHGNPVTIRERWSMPFSRAVGRREALTRLLLKMFPTRGPGDDKTARAAFWAAYFAARKEGK